MATGRRGGKKKKRKKPSTTRHRERRHPGYYEGKREIEEHVPKKGKGKRRKEEVHGVQEPKPVAGQHIRKRGRGRGKGPTRLLSSSISVQPHRDVVRNEPRGEKRKKGKKGKKRGA